MFPVLYDDAGPRVYGAVSPISPGRFAEAFRPPGGRNRRGGGGHGVAVCSTRPGRVTRTQAIDREAGGHEMSRFTNHPLLTREETRRRFHDLKTAGSLEYTVREVKHDRRALRYDPRLQ